MTCQRVATTISFYVVFIDNLHSLSIEEKRKKQKFLISVRNTGRDLCTILFNSWPRITNLLVATTYLVIPSTY